MSDAGLDALNDASNVEVDDSGSPVGNEPTETGGHPAWQEILDTLPTSLHPIVTPKLQEWDRGVQDRFQQVQSQYEPYKPFIENSKPEELEQALQLAKMLESDPQGFYSRMGQYFGSQDQGQTGNKPDAEEDEDVYDLSGQDDLDPRIKQQLSQLEQQQQMIAQHIQNQVQEEANKAAEAKLETDLKNLREQHGDFDEEFVLTYAMNNNGDLNKGVEKYMQLVGKLQGVPAPGSNLPKVLAPGGATPSTAVDPATLSSSDTKSLVVNLLQQASGQS